MVLGGSFEFSKHHNSEVAARPSDNEDIPRVSRHFAFNNASLCCYNTVLHCILNRSGSSFFAELHNCINPFDFAQVITCLKFSCFSMSSLLCYGK